MNRRLTRIIFIAVGLGYLISPDFMPGFIDDLAVLVLDFILYTHLSPKKPLK